MCAISSRQAGRMKDQRGATAILVGLLLVVFIGFAALAVDLGHLFVVRNELQNASDAGALAGARVLYNGDGTAVNEAANATAYESATSNKSEKTSVDVHWAGGNSGDVQRGHWSFAARTFTPNDSTVPVDLWNVTTEELDANVNFINAVRVKARRQDTPAASFFARIFGWKSFILSTESVAYIGFAGTLTPLEVDQPIAICKDSLLHDGEYTCNIGRMINSGQQVATNETGGWTSYYQGDDACQGGTNAQEVRSLVCGEGNPDSIILGKNMATNGGDIASAFKKMRDCWESATGRMVPWTLTLPVVECPSNNMGTCEKVVGAVTVNVVWITGEGDDPSYSDAPCKMEGWSSASTDGQQRWSSFVQYFSLQNVDGSPAPYQKKAIYFKPDCQPHIPSGRSGGENFGILAKIPVLVK
jgi:Flp pilus assembly protein TadG